VATNVWDVLTARVADVGATATDVRVTTLLPQVPAAPPTLMVTTLLTAPPGGLAPSVAVAWAQYVPAALYVYAYVVEVYGILDVHVPSPG
jgi:hypothetical protein